MLISAAKKYAPLDHTALDHTALDHTPLDHTALDHAPFKHRPPSVQRNEQHAVDGSARGQSNGRFGLGLRGRGKMLRQRVARGSLPGIDPRIGDHCDHAAHAVS